MEGKRAQINSESQMHVDEGEGIDIQKWIFKILKNWYWYAICIIIAVSLAWVANKSLNPVYNVGAVLLIDQDKQQNELSMDNMLEGYGLGDLSDITNQMVMLRSYSLIRRTVEAMNMPIDYQLKSQFRWICATENVPLKLSPLDMANRSNATFVVGQITNNTFTIRWAGDDLFDEIELTKKFGEIFLIGDMQVKVDKADALYLEEIPEVNVIYRSVDAIVADYSSRLSVQMVDEKSSILNVNLSGPDAARDIAFINTLIAQFQESNLERKNDVAIKTMNFIDKQLVEIADSLNVVGMELENFRSKNNIMDISIQVQDIIEKSARLEEHLNTLEEQRDYLKFLINYMLGEEDKEKLVAPSTTGITEAVINKLVLEFVDIQQMRNKQGPNIMREKYDDEMEQLKEAIVAHTESLLRNVDISEKRIKDRMSVLEKQTQQLPQVERELLTIQRKFDLNNKTYTYLLSKNAEAQILQASNSSDIVLLDKARNFGVTDGNKSKINFLIALVLGFGLPLGIQILLELLDNSVNDKRQLESSAKAYVSAVIPHSSGQMQPETVYKPESATSEAFRVIRLKLRRLRDRLDHGMAVMITSAMPNEGKSFVSINLAGSLAVSGEKVILIGLDLRRPSLEKILDITHDNGVIEYLDGLASKKDIIRKADDKIRFDLITTSSGRHDAGELMSDDKLRQLIVELKSEYNYVIIDIAPVGPTADPLAIDDLTETCLFLSRHRMGKLSFLESAMDEMRSSMIPNLLLIANDVVYDGPGSKYFGRSKYGYYYGYNYSYGSDYTPNDKDYLKKIKSAIGSY